MGSAEFVSREAAEAQVAAVLEQSSDAADVRMAEQAFANAAYYEAARQLAFKAYHLGEGDEACSILSAPVADQGSWRQQTEVQPKPTGSASG